MSGSVRKMYGLAPAVIFSIIIFSVDCVQAIEKNQGSHYMCKDMKGNKRWEATTKIRPMGGDNMYVFSEEGSGTFSGFDEPVRWKGETEYRDDGKKMIPIRMKKVITSADGTAVFEASQDFDIESGSVTSRKKWPVTGKETTKTFRYDGDILNDFLLGIYTERYLKAGEREKTYYLVTNDPDIYKITAKIEKEEEITVNGSTVKAYKIVLKPDVGMLGVFAGMLPKTYVWHLAQPDYDWLKYQGAEDTLASPLVEMETLDEVGVQHGK